MQGDGFGVDNVRARHVGKVGLKKKAAFWQRKNLKSTATAQLLAGKNTG
jgi:hypothetical protein